MSEVGRWLDSRRPAMPAELRRVVDRALDEAVEAAAGASGSERKVEGRSVTDGDVAERLAEAGLGALRRVAAASDRSTAPELLAADALLTYACEAAAEAGPERLDRLTASLDVGRFSALLEPRDS